jgi:heme exporter protein A
VGASNRLFVLKNLACARGGRALFQNLNLEAGAGDVVHLSGPNGAGKTSLLRVLAGALPFEGEILWDEKDFLENGRTIHAARYAFLPPDDRSLKVLETAYENLLFWATLWNASPAAIHGALAQMGLENMKETPVRRFSAGQKRRLSLARVLVKPAKLWLLDEPFNGLDAGAAALFAAALDRHVAAGGMAVIASHQPVQPPRGGRLARIELGAAA